MESLCGVHKKDSLAPFFVHPSLLWLPIESTPKVNQPVHLGQGRQTD